MCLYKKSLSDVQRFELYVYTFRLIEIPDGINRIYLLTGSWNVAHKYYTIRLGKHSYLVNTENSMLDCYRLNGWKKNSSWVSIILPTFLWVCKKKFKGIGKTSVSLLEGLKLFWYHGPISPMHTTTNLLLNSLVGGGAKQIVEGTSLPSPYLIASMFKGTWYWQCIRGLYRQIYRHFKYLRISCGLKLVLALLLQLFIGAQSYSKSFFST